ncbi:MAG: type I methionyl aminopeptidase [Bdellovibrionaceae bacterium]|nr:type I methionyl aminopeptidase [Pseudobdellovibrionaceae bacterium]
MTPLKANEIKLMEKAGQLAAETLHYVSQFVKPGITTNELDTIVHEYTLSKGAQSAPLGYHGYPKSICTSLNDCICHGVPDNTALKEGDIINIDVTTIKDGFHGDTSRTFMVGEVSESAKRIVDVAYQAMWEGLEQVHPNNKTGDIGFAINKFVTRKGYYAVKEIGGHGIGQTFHGEPFVPSHGKKGKGDILRPWTCITVEPMINETPAALKELPVENSSIKYYLTGDGTLSAQFEHTVLITDEGYQVLTLWDY